MSVANGFSVPLFLDHGNDRYCEILGLALAWFCITMLHNWCKKNLHHFVIQLSVKGKPKPSLTHFSTLPVREGSFKTFIGLSVSFLIGQCDYFGFYFTQAFSQKYLKSAHLKCGIRSFFKGT